MKTTLPGLVLEVYKAKFSYLVPEERIQKRCQDRMDQIQKLRDPLFAFHAAIECLMLEKIIRENQLHVELLFGPNTIKSYQALRAFILEVAIRSESSLGATEESDTTLAQPEF